MKKNPYAYFYLILLSPIYLLASEMPPNPDAQLSEAGVRRLEENKQIILNNIETVKTNVHNCQTNVSTLEKQVEEMAKVENELLKLKEQYESFLKKAQAESQKNQEALEKLAYKRERKPSSQERMERENWKRDTSDKINKVSKLLQKLKKDFVGVQIQKKDLLAQKNHWLDRQKHHEQVLEGLTTKQAALDKKLKG